MLPKDKGGSFPQIETVKVTLEQAIKAQRGSRCRAVLFL
jgi:hypothetical protein